MAWDPGTEKNCTCTYVGQLKEVGQTAALNKKFNMKIEPGFYLDMVVQASDFRGHVPGHCHRLFFNRTKYEVKQYVILKFWEHDLPLFLNWFWNDWVLLKLKELPDDKIKRSNTTQAGS